MFACDIHLFMLPQAMAPVVIAVDLTFLTGKYTHKLNKHTANAPWQYTRLYQQYANG